MDDVIFEEFKGTGNMEIHLDRSWSTSGSSRRSTSPSCGTRKEELLIAKDELNRIWILRRCCTPCPPRVHGTPARQNG